LYWHYLNKRKVREAKDQIRLMWGETPDEKASKALKQKELAERWQKDPLYGFPNDIRYFTRDQAMQKVKITERFGEKIAPRSRWGMERVRACVGELGIVARRCSMNDLLWDTYSRAKHEGVELTLDTVRRMIEYDILRSQLYPPGWSDDTVPPPKEFLEELQKQGKLKRIYAEMDRVFA